MSTNTRWRSSDRVRTDVNKQADDDTDGVEELLPPVEVEIDTVLAVHLAAVEEVLARIDEVKHVA